MNKKRSAIELLIKLNKKWIKKTEEEAIWIKKEALLSYWSNWIKKEAIDQSE